MAFSAIPSTYRNVIRTQYLAEVANGVMTVERYEQLTKETLLVDENEI